MHLMRQARKKAKDGSLRGRPSLFGRVGEYERVYAEVPPSVAGKLRDEARRRGASVSHVLRTMAGAHDAAEFRLRPPDFSALDGDERVYVQLPRDLHAKLRAEADVNGWAMSKLLAAIVDRHFHPSPARAAN